MNMANWKLQTANCKPGRRPGLQGGRHPASGIRHPASGIGHPASGIRHPASGFTLIELLVVLAILVLLMGLLFVPMLQTLNAVNRAQATTKAQDALNLALQQIVRDMEEAMYIYPPPISGYPTVHDAQVLARIDMILPEISGSGQIAYPPQRSNRIVRYFVAPLPEQATLFPDRLMWAAKPLLTPPETRLGYLNPFVNTFADQAQSNMVTLYRVEFSRTEPPFNQLTDAQFQQLVMNDPYFYMSDLPVAYRLPGDPPPPLPPPSHPLGQVWRYLSTALTPQPSTDLAIYFYDPAMDSYQPVMWPLSPSSPEQQGALPGISFAPKGIADETLSPVQSPEAVQYKSKWGNWANIPPPTLWHYNQGSLVTSYPVKEDVNGNGLLDAGEDVNANGVLDPGDEFGEPYGDGNGNGQYDVGEAFTDLNLNGIRDVRLTPFVDPVSGVLTFSRKSVELLPYPDVTRSWAVPLRSSAVLHVFQVSFGDRGEDKNGNGILDPGEDLNNNGVLDLPAFTNTRGRFKVVAGTERVFVMSISDPTNFREYRRTLGRPWPGEYRIDYATGILEFNDLNPPNLADPDVRLLVEYDYRDNFAWDPQSDSYTDDQVVASYGTRSQLRLTLSLAVYDATSNAPQVLVLSRSVGTKNPI